MDQIPDADPMLLDTDFVSASLLVPGDTLPVAGSAGMPHQPAPIRYRFEVASEPDRDPMLLEASLVMGSVASKPTAICYRFEVSSEPDRDPMLLEAHEMLEASLVGGSVASTPGPAPIRYRFEVASDPDRDPMLQEASLIAGSVASKPAPIRYRFEVASEPDHDPMLLEAWNILEAGLVKGIANSVVIPARKTDARQHEAAGITAASLVRIFR
ncbi:hypothetical protein WJU16_10505 [Chitinophaga pollutisoli]|uniref:DUF4255 domain-containing protein n=1 Tax=Chitinophaga pollutisoli TaxID=3133966 RepID=A0ABZ2YW22_9BACT